MKIRVITPIYNERELLPGFFRHYEKIADSIFILDNGSTDGSLEIAQAHPLVDVFPFEMTDYDEMSLQRALRAARKESHDCDWCLFPDCDEILAMRDGSSLRTYLATAGQDYDIIRAAGYNLVKHESDAPFDARKEWLGQRTFGFPDKVYSKPTMLRPDTPATLTVGNHNVVPSRPEWVEREKLQHDGSVVLLHFEMIDFYLWYYRKTRRPISDENRANGWTQRFCKTAADYHCMWAEALAKGRSLVDEVPILRGVE